MRVAGALPGAPGTSAGAFRFRASVIVLLALLALNVVNILVRRTEPFDPFLDGWLVLVAEVVAVAVCVRSLIRTGFSQWQVVFGSAAVAATTIADAYNLLFLGGRDALVHGGVGAALYLPFYPLALAALIVIMQRLRGLPWALLLDTVVGSLTSAAVTMLVLAPVLPFGSAESATSYGALHIIHPLLSLFLVTLFGGLLTSRDLDLGPRWMWLIGGLMVVTHGDVTFAMNDDGVGWISELCWLAGLVALAVWVDGASEADDSPRRRNLGLSDVAAPMLSTIGALSVVVFGLQVSIPLLAQVFAVLALALAAVPLVFRNRTLATLATTDDLTGLPNRRALTTLLPPRLQGGPGALFMLDLDRFKYVNDALGHDVGDALLVLVGRRFTKQLRPGDLLARLGGDEFAVFLDGASAPEAVAIAQRLEAELADPIIIGEASLQVSVSIGIALSPESGTDLDFLMRKADVAMFTAKAHRSGHHVYTAADDDDGALKLRTLQELRLALVEGQFRLHYQPKVCLRDGEVAGVEALVRWEHPVRGQLSPAAFLPLAEDAGLMPALSMLVLEQAVRQVAEWRAHGVDITVAVNLSGSYIPADLPRLLLIILEEHEVPTSALVIEITEDVLMVDAVHVAGVLRRLRAAGIQVSIDDFGTGYSSLSYLRDLPVDELKLDRSFITAMPHDVRARGLVGSIIDLAHSLGLRVVAEGVEDDCTRQELLLRGCDLAQGFHFARPLPAHEIPGWIRTNRAWDAPADALLRMDPPLDPAGGRGAGVPAPSA